jgi:hypothetical protein
MAILNSLVKFLVSQIDDSDVVNFMNFFQKPKILKVTEGKGID